MKKGLTHGPVSLIMLFERSNAGLMAGFSGDAASKRHLIL